MPLLLAVLMGVALVVKFWPVIVGIVGVIVAGYWVRRAAGRHAERVETEWRRLTGLEARADEQHEWVMGGDERVRVRRISCCANVIRARSLSDSTADRVFPGTLFAFL
jgi:hypothetical protein